MDTSLPNFEGHVPRSCGEHRTVGEHRAWCHDCSEWCYPEGGCIGCQCPDGVEAALERLRVALDTLTIIKRHCEKEIAGLRSGCCLDKVDLAEHILEFMQPVGGDA